MIARIEGLPNKAPSWHGVPLLSGRGHGGTDLFQRVHYFDIADRNAGHAAARILQGATGPLGLSVVESTGHEIGLEEGRALTLLLPLSGLVFSATGPNDLVARPGQAMILPRGRRRTVTSRDGARLFRAIVLVLPDIPDLQFLRHGRVFAASAQPDLAEAARILQAICTLESGDGLSAANALRLVKSLVGGAVAALRTDADGPLRQASERSLRRAEGLLRDGLAEDVAMRDIAQASGLSLRRLQELFRHHHGLSPHAYLTRLRLEAAHLNLKGSRPAPSVTEAALQSGFGHLGRFPRTYRSRFGELPSQALAASS